MRESPPLLERPLVRGAIAAALLALMFGGLLLAQAFQDDGDGSDIETASRGALDDRAPVRGEPAPDFELRTIEGELLTLSDLRGSIVWVNFWAVSCEPCRTEMPAMQRIAEAYGEDVAILGVNWGEDPERAADFAERLGITYPILLDPGLEAFYAWAGTDGLPRHYFIGPEGTVMREIVGPLDPARMVEIVDELLATSPMR